MTADSHGGALIGVLDQHYRKLENALNLTAAGFIFFLMFLATIQVFSRKLLNVLIPGYIDYAEQSIAIFAFLGVAYCQRLGGHVRMELVLDKLPKGRVLWLFEAITTLAALAIILVLCRYSFDHFLRAWVNGDSTIDINLPIWPFKLLVAIALGVLSVRLALQLAGFVRLFLHPNAVPVGVPLIADVAKQASIEAEQVTTRNVHK
ncbi:MAG: TRAP transporter small permease subunit [Rhodobacteraceae bacterium]|nr:TRAP transporter small permease subunit [Paracoccaceae bacterium]